MLVCSVATHRIQGYVEFSVGGMCRKMNDDATVGQAYEDVARISTTFSFGIFRAERRIKLELSPEVDEMSTRCISAITV